MYLGLPISVLITLFFNTDITQIENTKLFSIESLILLIDYVLFIGSCSTLFALRNAVIIAKYIPKEKVIEFTKFNMFGKRVKKSVDLDNIQRMRQSHLAPNKVLKNRETFEDFSMNSKDKYFDFKLYNTLFPKI